MCQRFNVAEQILAQIGDDALAHPLQDHGLQVGAAHGEHQHACIHRHAQEEGAEFKLPGHQLLDAAHDEG